MIGHGKNGLLFPVGDEAALTDALRELLSDAGKRAALARAARETAEGFRPEVIFKQWEHYIQSVIDGKERRA